MKLYRTDLIAAATGSNDLKHSNGNTQDIINVLLEADGKAAAFTKKFAPTLKGASLFDTCKNVYDFVKTQIPYKFDTPGYQWIKSPGRLFQDKKGDCKSFSLFIASCLKNLAIPYGYRFVSYRQDDPTPTHVYMYVPLSSPSGGARGGREIILDAVWKGPFNTQKPFAHKKDYLMAKISYLGSASAATADGHVPGMLKLPKPYHEMSDEEMALYLSRQRVEIEKHNAAKIGSPYADRYDAALNSINNAIANIDNPDAIIGMADDMIGKAKAKGKKAPAGKLLKKIGTGLKKAVKTTAKVVTAPARLIAKGALEIYLPKAAPFFLYLFTPAGIKLPDLMARKKQKQEKLKNFIVNGIGMKEPHFMAIIRNNLTKRLGKSPESYLQEHLVKRISGIAGNNKKKARYETYMAGIGKTKALKKQLATPVKSVKAGAPGLPKMANKLTTLVKPVNVQPTSDQKEKKGFFKKLTQPNEGTKLNDVIKNAGKGDLVGTIMSAVSWLIEKVGSVFKKDKPEKITADDMPDIERDASNAFEWQDMKEDYGNLNDQQKEETKFVAADIIEQVKEVPVVKETIQKIEEQVKKKLPFLNDNQVKEVVEEIEEGPEALDEDEGRNLGNQIKRSGLNNGNINMQSGGGATGGFCQC